MFVIIIPKIRRRLRILLIKMAELLLIKGTNFNEYFRRVRAQISARVQIIFSFTKKDNAIYVQMMAAGIDSRFGFLRKLASDMVSTMVAKEPLKSPSRKEAFDLLKSTINEVGPSKGIKPFNKDFSDKGALLWYQEANTKIVIQKNTALNKAYFEKLKKKGYNILLDEMDTGFLSELPIVVLNGEKSLRPISMSDITGADVRTAKAFLKDNGGDTIRSINELHKQSR